MENVTKDMLKTIADIEGDPAGAFNIRENGKGIKRQATNNISINTKEDKPRDRYNSKRKYNKRNGAYSGGNYKKRNNGFGV